MEEERAERPWISWTELKNREGETNAHMIVEQGTVASPDH